MENQGRKYNVRFSRLAELVVRKASISRSAKLIFIDLLLYAGTDGSAFPSHQTLANNAGLSKRRVNDLLQELKRANLVSWSMGSPGRSNRYKITPEIYFPNAGTPVQSNRGSQLQPNVVNEWSKRKRFKPCGIGSCVNGYLTNSDPVVPCQCLKTWGLQNV